MRPPSFASCRPPLLTRGTRPFPSTVRSSWGQEDTAARTELLDEFWQQRGVVDPALRRTLADIADEPRIPLRPQNLNPDFEAELPGIISTWQLDNYGVRALIQELSRRLLKLQSMLGGQGVDVAWMVAREPRLLSAEPRSVVQRLVELRVAAAGATMDVIDLVERQPALLLVPGAAAGAGGAEESMEERIAAWEAGLMSDNDREWLRRFKALQAYRQSHGDPHVGFREGDDAELSRWAAKQRRDHKGKSLSEEKASLLEGLGFRWSDEDAEWLRWYNELSRTKDATERALPSPLTDIQSFYLTNWCAVQRIARRCNRLAKERISLLDGLGFDWTAPDALS